MKIGIITFHRAYNIGASLQSFALLHYLQSEGYDVELIDYYPNNSIPTKKSIIRKILHSVHILISYKQMKEFAIRDEAFQNFWRNNYRLSTKCFYGDESIGLCGIKYDVLISGSDQILNTTLTGDSVAYYLGFDDEAEKMSYASSFGRDSITEYEHELIKKELIKFKSISVREKSAARIIYSDIGYQPEIVVDPVFLLQKGVWEDMRSLKKCVKEKFILVYAMEYSPQIKNTVKFAMNHFDLQIITVYGYHNDISLPGKKVTCGPEEFLGLVSSAEYIITNSFHGTALSLIFGKKVFVCSHTTKNTRLQNIMEIVDEESKLIDENTLIDNSLFVDGCVAYSKLQPNIRLSKEYLKKNI